jgi:2-amino-4-hydroxy-6-hydroxymethyldihydropteridine diphosphokinase
VPAEQFTTAYIALGSNLGSRAAHIHSAVDRLRATKGVRVTKVSSLLENPAIGGPPDSPPFLNAAAEVQTTLNASELLERLLAIERELGRERHEKWGPRTIDLDLLLYGKEQLDEVQVQVPHPLLHERLFVLQPLAEIAPEVVHPVLQQTIRALRDAKR